MPINVVKDIEELTNRKKKDILGLLKKMSSFYRFINSGSITGKT